jgi:hypothetical protein
MILMHKETGTIFEMMVYSLEDTGEFSKMDGKPRYRIGDIGMMTVFNQAEESAVKACPVNELADHFEFIGFV